jgi:hypothetical protein
MHAFLDLVNRDFRYARTSDGKIANGGGGVVMSAVEEHGACRSLQIQG